MKMKNQKRKSERIDGVTATAAAMERCNPNKQKTGRKKC